MWRLKVRDWACRNSSDSQRLAGGQPTMDDLKDLNHVTTHEPQPNNISYVQGRKRVFQPLFGILGCVFIKLQRNTKTRS